MALVCGCGEKGSPTSPGPTPAPKKAEVIEIIGISNGATDCGGTVFAGRLVEIKFAYSSREIVTPAARLNGAADFRVKPADLRLPPTERSTMYYGVSCPVTADGHSPCDRNGQPLTTTTLGVALVSVEGHVLDSREMPCRITWSPNP